VDIVKPGRMIQPWSALHSWAIHAEQGQYHVSSSSGGVATRKGLHQDSFLYTREIQNMARQNHVGGNVALIRGVWVYDG
jgi:hypothetical protein